MVIRRGSEIKKISTIVQEKHDREPGNRNEHAPEYFLHVLILPERIDRYTGISARSLPDNFRMMILSRR